MLDSTFERINVWSLFKVIIVWRLFFSIGHFCFAGNFFIKESVENLI